MTPTMDDLKAWVEISRGMGMPDESIKDLVYRTITTPEEPVRDDGPFNRTAFIKQANSYPYGTQATCKEIANDARISWPERCKSAHFILRNLGWTDAGERRNGCNVFQKRLSVAAAD